MAKIIASTKPMMLIIQRKILTKIISYKKGKGKTDYKARGNQGKNDKDKGNKEKVTEVKEKKEIKKKKKVNKTKVNR